MPQDPFSKAPKDPFRTSDHLNPTANKDIFVKPKSGGGLGRTRKPEEPAEPLDIPIEPVAPEPEKPKPTVVLRNPKWEVEKVGFNEETDISVELTLPPEQAHKTKVAFELFAKTPQGPERMLQAEAHAEGGKAICRIPVYIPKYKDANGNSLQKMEYYFTAKHSESALLDGSKAPKLIDEKADRLIESHILPDLTFAFDKSFLHPKHAAELEDMCAKIKTWRQENPDGKLAVFGHADAVGKEDYNKALSERRAKSVFGFLMKDAGTWSDLDKEEAWDLACIQDLLRHLGHDPGASDGQDGPKTQAAVKAFQTKHGLTVDGKAGPVTRKAMYQAFMDECNDLSLKTKDFDDIKGNTTAGCSEFNLVQKTEGASEVNRRVAVLLLKSNKNFPIRYPCVKGDVGPCKLEVAKKGVRRTPGFSCFFYDELVDESPVLPIKKGKALPLILVDGTPASKTAGAGAAGSPPAASGPQPAAVPANAGSSPATPAPTPAPAPSAGTGSAGDTVPDPAFGPGNLVALVAHPGIGGTPVILKLKTDIAFDGTGCFTRSIADIDFFRKGSAAALKFDGTDNDFNGAALTQGVELEARGIKASAKAEEITLTLTLNGGSVKPGPPTTTKATSVEVTLGIGEPRVDTATEPVKMPGLAANAPNPAPGSATDKVFLGRPLPLQTNPKLQERAMLIVEQVKPADFKGTLVLSVENDKLMIFADEEFKTGETPTALPLDIDIAGIPAAGRKFFLEGAKASAAARDTGVILGIKGANSTADQVKVTVCHAEVCSNKKPADLKTVAQVPEKPARATKSTFTPAPLIMGLKYDIEMRPFLEIAKPKTFKWKSDSDKLKLKDDAKEVVGCHGEKLSAAEADALLELALDTDIGKMKLRHKLTVVSVEINPVISGTSIVHGDALNKIENPSGCVILSGGAAADGNQVPIYKMTKITPNLAWTDDDPRLAWWIIGGEAKADEKYDGKADFLNTDPGKYGQKIQVFGTQLGDVLIQPYSGGYGFGMFRAHVVPIQKVKFRVNRILTTAQAASPAVPALPAQAAQLAFPGSSTVPAQPAVPALPAIAARPALTARLAKNPTATSADADLHMKIVNIYLRQAGIEMIPDTSAEFAVAPKAAQPALPATTAQPTQAAQAATPAAPGVPAMPAVPTRPAVPALPAVPAQAAQAANDKIGKSTLDAFVEKVTQVAPGFFDVEVNSTALTFLASDPNSLNAIKINARNEVIVLAYIHSQATAGALATALLCPWNHAPLARANPPRQPFTSASYTLSDKNTPSSSLIPKTGIPDDVPVGAVKMRVLSADMAWEGSSPATRKEELLWGVIVPTSTIDASVAAPTADKINLAYGNTLAHELGHVFGLGHRGGGGVPDGLMIPANENIMHPSNPPPLAENIDIIQVKAMRFSEAFFRNP